MLIDTTNSFSKATQYVSNFITGCLNNLLTTLYFLFLSIGLIALFSHMRLNRIFNPSMTLLFVYSVTLLFFYSVTLLFVYSMTLFFLAALFFNNLNSFL